MKLCVGTTIHGDGGGQGRQEEQEISVMALPTITQRGQEFWTAEALAGSGQAERNAERGILPDV
jgi:hypothetical protein